MAADPDWSGLNLAFRSGSRRSPDDALFEPPEPLARSIAARRNELTELMGEKD